MAVKLERQCAACGAELGGGQLCERCGADQKVLSFEQDKARMLHSGPLRSARSSLLWVGSLLAVGALFSFARSEGRAVAPLVVGLGIAALFAALWQWSKQRPFGATAAGLGIYLTLLVGDLVVDPAILLQGLVVRIVIVVLLIRGVRAGVVLRRHRVSGI